MTEYICPKCGKAVIVEPMSQEEKDRMVGSMLFYPSYNRRHYVIRCGCPYESMIWRLDDDEVFEEHEDEMKKSYLERDCSIEDRSGMDDLEPCPKCGCNRLHMWIRCNPTIPTRYAVECDDCKYRGPIADSRQEAEYGWKVKVSDEYSNALIHRHQFDNMTDGITKQGADAIAEAFTTAYESKMTMESSVECGRRDLESGQHRGWIERTFTVTLDFDNHRDMTRFTVIERDARSIRTVLFLDGVTSVVADDTALTVTAGIYTVQIAIVQEQD